MITPKVVLHAPTEDALVRARSNARNVLAVSPSARVEIVVNAGAVASALTTRDAQTDPLLRLCSNTLRNKGVEAPGGLTVVSAAVLHLAQRQAEGWAYIRS